MTNIKFIDWEYVNPLRLSHAHKHLHFECNHWPNWIRMCSPKRSESIREIYRTRMNTDTGTVASFRLNNVAKINSVLCIRHGWMDFVFIFIICSECIGCASLSFASCKTSQPRCFHLNSIDSQLLSFVLCTYCLCVCIIVCVSRRRHFHVQRYAYRMYLYME